MTSQRSVACLLIVFAIGAAQGEGQAPIARDGSGAIVGAYVGKGDASGQSVALISRTGFSFTVNQITGELSALRAHQAGTDVEMWAGPLYQSPDCSGQAFIHFTPSFGTTPLIGGFVIPLRGQAYFTQKTEVSVQRSFQSQRDAQGACLPSSVSTPRALRVFLNDESTTGVSSSGYQAPVTLSLLTNPIFANGFEPS